ncbi:hypothetical protein BDN72DRAFT_878061 [Pluteus cervinus]|uniref:Uncharacterized protein n=1 Tax=Pluteus cervinus TaxID=181527 RepID=A0ACD3AVY2_9AGAR|nr:hypothetical protein BDN72DRAFT_878061 [Pluteus cervinus]
MFIHARLASQLASRLTFSSLTRSSALSTNLVHHRVAANSILGTTPKWNATRSFLTSAHVETPAKTKTKAEGSKGTTAKKTKAEATTKPKKRTLKKRAVVKKKPAKKPVKKPLVVKPNMLPPKKAISPYFRFYQSYLSGLPKPTSVEEVRVLASQCAQAWRALSESEKQPYVDAFAVDRIEHDKKRMEWFNNVDPAVLRAINKRKVAKGNRKIIKPRNPDAPKRPMTSFFLFANDHRHSIDPSLKTTDKAKKLGEAWKSLPAEEKERYAKTAAEGRAEFRANHPKPSDA